MSSAARSPRRLPARVYWFRRLLVLGTVLAFVFTGARLLQSEDPAPSAGTARVVLAPPTPVPTADPGSRRSADPTTAPPTPTPTVLAEPDGPCAAEEVTVAPVEGSAAAGRTVPLVLQLTGSRPACTFAVSPSSLAVKVSGSGGKVWSSQDCPGSVASSTVVVRNAAPISIQVTWSGRRSDGTCSPATAWALPGSYLLSAAALGSAASTAPLRLTVPERPVVIRTVAPKPAKKSPTPDAGKPIRKPSKPQSSAPVTPNTGP